MIENPYLLERRNEVNRSCFHLSHAAKESADLQNNSTQPDVAAATGVFYYLFA